MTKTYSGFIAIIGPTNAGKSTLMNQIMGRKVSIVSHKVQTTRTRLRAIKMVGDKQLIFVDTPGVFKPSRRLDRAMVGAAMSALDDADLAITILNNDVEIAIENNGEDSDLILFKAENILEEILLRTQLRIQIAKNELIANLQEDLDDTIEEINLEESISELKDKSATVITTLEGKIATEKEEFNQKYGE